MLPRARSNGGLAPVTLCLLALLTICPAAGQVSEPEGELQTPTVEDEQTDTPEEGEPASTFYATATVEARPLESATSTVTVLEKAEIEALNPRHVGDLLPWIPGLLVDGPASRSGLTSARIRGGDPNFTLVLIDGVPLNDSTDPLGGAFNLASLPINGVDRVEVVRGPLSTYFGSTGLSGAINVVTQGGDTRELDVEIQAGSDSLLRTSLSYARPGTKVDSSFALSWEEEAGKIGEDRFEQLAFLGSLGLQPTKHSRLDLRARFSTSEGEDYPESSGGPVYSSGDLRLSQYDELSLAAEWITGKGGSRGHHRTRASYFRRETDRTSPGILPLVPPAEEESRYTDIQLAWAGALEINRALNLAIGADVAREEGRNRSLLFFPPAIGGETPGDFDIDRVTGGTLVELAAKLGHLQLEAGTRLDLPEASSSEWSPRLALSYRPGGGSWRLRASLGESFKLPSFFALASPPALGGNPDLRPEKALGADLGVEASLAGGRFDLAVTLFAIDYEDLIDFDFETFRLINRSRVEARGIETSFAWIPSPALTLRFDLTFQDVDDPDSSVELLQLADWFGGLRLEWRPTARLSLLFDARSVDDILDRQIPIPERTVVQGYRVVGLSAAWAIDRQWSIRARLENLTAEEYETLIGFPGEDRGMRIGLRYHRR